MVSFWFSSEKKKKENNREAGFAVVGFIQSVFAATIGCFLGCFRTRDSRNQVSRSKNVLSSLFIRDDESRGDVEEHRQLLGVEADFVDLKDEAKFLKACGTLPETPSEIRKWSQKWECVSDHYEGDESSTSNLTFGDSSNEKTKLEELSDESPITTKPVGECDTGAGSSEDTPSSCIGCNTGRGSISSNESSQTKNTSSPDDVCDSENHSPVSPLVFAPSIQSKIKSVRFHCERDASAISTNSTSSEHPKESGSDGSRSCTSKPSPYPTPLRITDDMQTPGTVFPSYIRNMDAAKTTRIRTQYVYSFINTLQNPLELADDSSDSDHLEDLFNPNEEATLTPSPKSDMALKEISDGEEMKYETSLSSWLMPLSPKQDGDNEQFGFISDENSHGEETPGDRPGVGTVEVNLDGEGKSHISPAMWAGNGIPNTTKKYKEDQRVCWHATPFEVRLEKALSADTVIHRS